MAGIPYRTGNLLCWDSIQRRGGKSKRPFFIFWPVQIRRSTAPADGRDRKSLEEHALWAGSIRYLKSVLDSIRSLTEFSQDRFSDKEVGQFLYRMTIQEIARTDFFLTSLLNYFQATAPIKRANTVNALIEEVLKKSKVQLEDKNVHLFKKLEENLPEIIVPDDPLKYILNSVFQYVVLSTPRDGNIAFRTTSFVFQREGAGTQALFERYGGYVEISVIFPDIREATRHPKAAQAHVPTSPKGEVLDLMLRLVKGVVLKHWGKMEFEKDAGNGNTVISLRFPLERRKLFFCQPHPAPPPAARPQS